MQFALFPKAVRAIGSVVTLSLLGTLAVLTPAMANDSSDVDPANAPGIADRAGYTPQFTTLPATLDPRTLRRDAAGRLIAPLSVVQPPSWAGTTTSPLNRVKYDLTFLGASPTTKGKSNIGLYMIAWRFKFANGLTTDATKPACGDTTPVFDRVYFSPVLQDANFSSNGTSVGSREYIDAFQTAEFAGEHFSSSWRTNFVPSPIIWFSPVIDVPASDGTASVVGNGCVFGQVLNSYLNALVVKEIQALQGAKGRNGFVVSHSSVAFNLLNDTVSYTVTKNVKSCCIIGYHSAYGTSSYNQVYGVGAWVDGGIFGGETDVAAISHEIGELVNDPYVNNGTPAWGHVGQVSGCQGNFEVGDPLTGTAFSYTLNGYKYHLQELAFFGWYYRESGLGTGNKYSFNGTFKTYQNTICK
jgi:hypothetical protein